jgi:SagB-type dehydrogenase family enzyme
VPSGGARHPFETYLLVNRVEGLAPGVYRYLPLGHALVPVRKGKVGAEAIGDACYGQAFVGDAAAVFVWAAIPYRTAWRYGSMAERMVPIEAGHICQNLYLAAESIGAATCAVLGFDRAKIDALIGVDGKDERTIYLAPVGKRMP